MASKKSQQFQNWIKKETGVDPTVPAMRLLTELEQAARLLGHQMDLIGEVDAKAIHAVIRASKNLQAEYENQSG